jgi:hypothetical protein
MDLRVVRNRVFAPRLRYSVHKREKTRFLLIGLTHGWSETGFLLPDFVTARTNAKEPGFFGMYA